MRWQHKQNKATCKAILLAFIVTGFFTPRSYGFDHQYVRLADFLRRFVQAQSPAYSGIHFKDIKKNEEPLQQLVSLFEDVKESEFESWSPNEKIPFLINAYNVAAIRLIVSKYPVESVKIAAGLLGLWSPFYRDSLTLLGKKRNLSQIQSMLLRATEGKPDVLMTLACGAKMCPAIRYEPYTKAWVAQQIADANIQFVKDGKRVKWDDVSKVVVVSPVFKTCTFSSWNHCLGKLFESHYGKLQAYLISKTPGDSELNKARENYSVTFLDPDWALSE